MPPKGFKRLVPGGEVRLRGAGIVRCDEVDQGRRRRVVELRGTLDPESRPGMAGADRKVKGTIHWVSAQHAVRGGSAPVRPPVHRARPGRRRRRQDLPATTSTRIRARVVHGYVEPAAADADAGAGASSSSASATSSPTAATTAPTRRCSTAASPCATPGPARPEEHAMRACVIDLSSLFARCVALAVARWRAAPHRPRHDAQPRDGRHPPPACAPPDSAATAGTAERPPCAPAARCRRARRPPRQSCDRYAPARSTPTARSRTSATAAATTRPASTSTARPIRPACRRSARRTAWPRSAASSEISGLQLHRRAVQCDAAPRDAGARCADAVRASPPHPAGLGARGGRHRRAPTPATTTRSRSRSSCRAATSKQRSGGPFGAAVFGPDDRIIAVGVNRVLPHACSLAHAEMMAYMLAQQRTQRARLNERRRRTRRPDHARHLVAAVLPVLRRDVLGRHRRAADRRAQRRRDAR